MMVSIEFCLMIRNRSFCDVTQLCKFMLFSPAFKCATVLCQSRRIILIVILEPCVYMTAPTIFVLSDSDWGCNKLDGF
jgi:hypothetical protein